MLVFLQIPRSTTGPYRAFCEALGSDAVGWVGRNLKPADLDDPAALGDFKVVGGRIPLDKALALKGVTAFTTVINDPVSRSMAQWTEAIADANHPHHDAAHTFMLRELFEEEHPFAAAMSNLATRALMPAPDEPPSAETALAAIRSRRFIISDSAHTRAFARVVGRLLELPPETIDETAFRPPETASSARGELQRLIRAANREDMTLLRELKQMTGDRPIVNTMAARRRAASAQRGGPAPGAA